MIRQKGKIQAMTFGKGQLNSAHWQCAHPCGKSGGAFQNATATNKLNKAVERNVKQQSPNVSLHASSKQLGMEGFIAHLCYEI